MGTGGTKYKGWGISLKTNVYIQKIFGGSKTKIGSNGKKSTPSSVPKRHAVQKVLKHCQFTKLTVKKIKRLTHQIFRRKSQYPRAMSNLDVYRGLDRKFI